MNFNNYGKAETAPVKESIETRGSSMFTELSYNNGTMIVDMVNFGRYEYRNVPIEVWQRFKKASSYGSFYNQYIKGVFTYIRLR